MVRIAICDDLSTDRRRLNDLLTDYFSDRGMDFSLDMFPSADALAATFEPMAYQVIFMDIYMPGTSGVRMAERIRSCDGECAIIFTTTSVDHSIESYAVRAAGYLVKPYSSRQLKEALDWCLADMAGQIQAIEIVSDREKRSILVRDILYIEVFGRRSVLVTTHGEFSTNRSITELAKEVGDSFLRFHRSLIVNMEHIQKPDGYGFILTDGKRLSTSVDNASRIRQQFFDWTFSRTWESR